MEGKLRRSTRNLFALLAVFVLASCLSSGPTPLESATEEVTTVGAAGLSPTAQTRPRHVIWDDDGSPDGVIALLYFLQHPDIVVDAVTVSCGEAHPDTFADNLDGMLARIERTGIPIAGGRLTPLAGNNAFPEPWRRASDEFWEISLPEGAGVIRPQTAAELMVEVLNQSAEPVTIFISGTHTNLAEALRMDPGIEDKIASVQVMGGALYVPGNIGSDWPKIHNSVAEWNIWVDPSAANEVFRSGLPVAITPLDATNQVIWTSADADTWALSGTPEGILAAEVLRWMLRSWYPEGVYVWDLVAAVNATDPSLCRQEPLHIEVVTDSGDEEGRTLVKGNRPVNATACIAPQTERIKALVAHTFGVR